MKIKNKLKITFVGIVPRITLRNTSVDQKQNKNHTPKCINCKNYKPTSNNYGMCLNKKNHDIMYFFEPETKAKIQVPRYAFCKEFTFNKNKNNVNNGN